jgi:hypothetical protein
MMSRSFVDSAMGELDTPTPTRSGDAAQHGSGSAANRGAFAAGIAAAARKVDQLDDSTAGVHGTPPRRNSFEENGDGGADEEDEDGLNFSPIDGQSPAESDGDLDANLDLDVSEVVAGGRERALVVLVGAMGRGGGRGEYAWVYVGCFGRMLAVDPFVLSVPLLLWWWSKEVV